MTKNFDFHIHSIYSRDSILKPETIIKIAKKRELSGIAITDHNTIKGALKTKSIVTDGFVVIVGAEIQTDECEIIGLFLNEEIRSRKFGEVIDEIKDQGGISVLPHPYRNIPFINPNNLLGMIDLVEGLNGRTSKELNFKAQNLARNHGYHIIAGSDAHTPFEIGRVQNILDLKEINFASIKKCLLEGNIAIKGEELPYHLRLLSSGVGRVKKDGFRGLTKSFMNKVLNNR